MAESAQTLLQSDNREDSYIADAQNLSVQAKVIIAAEKMLEQISITKGFQFYTISIKPESTTLPTPE